MDVIEMDAPPTTQAAPPEDERDVREALATVLRLVGSTREDALDSTPGYEDAELEGALRATEAVRRSVDALELTLVAEVDRRGEERGPDGLFHDIRLAEGQVAEMAPDAVALAIGVGPTEAGRRCDLAARAATDLADLASLLARGRVSRRSLEQVHRHTRDTDEETTRAIVDHLLGARRGRPDSIRITEMEPHEVSQTCRRLITRLDPDLMRRRAEDNRAHRLGVRTEPGPVGTSCLTATLPAEMGAAVQSAVDEAGRLRLEDDPSIPVGTARALGLADLVLRGVSVSAEVRLGIPVIASAASRLTFAPVAPTCSGCHGGAPDPFEGLLGPGVGHSGPATSETVRIVTGSGPDRVDVLSEEWLPEVTTQARAGEGGDAPWVSGTMVPGVGFIPPDVVAAIVARLDTTVGRALLDARTGTLLETSTPRYAIPRAQREFVATRDGTCRMWGCARPVHSTRLGWQADVDHATPWPTGGTSPANLSALCRHHHRVKHSPRWTHRLHEDGSTEWITPGGTPAFTFPVHTVDGDDEVVGAGWSPQAGTSRPAATGAASSPSTGTNDAPGVTGSVSSPSTGTREHPGAEADDPPPF